MNTKEKIISEALNLFSVKGYSGTSINDIAGAVGIKGSSLYKHFKNKKEIFDTIVEEMSKRMEGLSETFDLPDNPGSEDIPGTASVFGDLSEEGVIELSKKIFLFYLRDDFSAKFRRMLVIEQYKDEDIYRVYRSIFMEKSIEYQTALFGEMMQQGLFIEADPKCLAMNFYSPIFFLLNKYDGDPDEAEALKELRAHVTEFCRIYAKKQAVFM